MEFISRHRVVIVSLVLVGGLALLAAFSTPKNTYKFVADETMQQFSMGDKNASVKLVQYSDFLCPSCSQVSLGVMPEIVKNYVDTGKVYFEFRVMSFIASGSQTAAEGAYCAADQGKFWAYHDEAYKQVWEGYFSKSVSPYSVDLYTSDGVKNIARIAEVEQAQFDKCLDERSTRQTVTSATKNYQQNGVNATPYITVNDIPITGVPTYEMIEAAIKASL